MCLSILPVPCLHAIFVLCEVSEITFTVGFSLESAKSQVDEFCNILGVQVSCGHSCFREVAVSMSGRCMIA